MKLVQSRENFQLCSIKYFYNSLHHLWQPSVKMLHEYLWLSAAFCKLLIQRAGGAVTVYIIIYIPIQHQERCYCV